MKRAALLVAALIIGAILANTLLPENGYVAVSFHGYLIEMSVPTLALLLLLTLLGLHALLWLLRAPGWLRAARREQRRRRAREDLARALMEMAAGRWAESETTATRAARDAEWPVAHYLLGARAADLQGQAERRRAWLAMAREAAPDEPGPALVTAAEFSLKHGEHDAARDALASLALHGPLNPHALLLLARIHRARGDFAALKELEPELRNSRGILPPDVDAIMDTLYLDMLRAATESGGPAAVEAVWSDATKAARHRPAIVVAYAQARAKFGEPERAASLLEHLIEDEWNEAAVLLYGELPGGDPFRRLKHAEAWLKSRREDPALLVTCARLSLRAELYGKARSYLETSYALRPNPQTAQLLAELLEQLGEPERAARLLREALERSVGRRAGLPPVRLRRFGLPRRERS
jgi:HemY protein